MSAGCAGAPSSVGSHRLARRTHDAPRALDRDDSPGSRAGAGRHDAAEPGGQAATRATVARHGPAGGGRSLGSRWRCGPSAWHRPIGRVSSESSIGTIHLVESAGRQRLQRLEVLEGHRLLVDRPAPRRRSSAARWLKPSARRICDCRSPSARRMLDCLSPSATLIVACRVPSDSVMHRAPVALGAHLAVHRVLDVARRHDLADLDARDLHAPALGHLVELGAQDVVDLLALGQHVVQRDVADDGAQRGRRQRLGGAGEVGDGGHRLLGSKTFE